MSHRAGLDKTVIVEAAARLVDEEGVEQLTLGRLAERLGVRTPSLYNHVAGLPGLKHELALYCLRDLLGFISRSAIGKSRSDAIFAFAHAYLTYARERPGRYSFTISPDPDDPEVQELARQNVEVSRAILAPYKLPDEETIHAIRSLRSIVHGFILLDKASGFRMPVDPNVTFDWMLHLFIDGLERKASS
ncbi:MAG TPA: WHG domain-containing protein [Ktedonobacteraceae bacterium]|nr:WHG domain-containing protein [Ktedonobacteraceae bacterium]